MELEKIFIDLESNQTHDSEESKKKLVEFFSHTKEQYLVHNMLEYFLKTGSERIMEVLVKVQSPHDSYIFDRLDEWLKTQQYRVQALKVFCFVIRKHPTWLFKIEKHRLIKSVFKLLTHEKEIVPLMSALLGIITLLPIIPNSVPNFLPELFEVFGNLASWKLQNTYRLTNDKLVHLQLGLQMLFHRLYGMYPCNFLGYLRDFIKNDKGGGIFQHTIKPLLETVRVHPMLLTASVETETISTRWKEMEPHDIVMECAHLSLPVVHPDFSNEHSSSCYPMTPGGMLCATPSFSRMTSTTSNSDYYSYQYKDLQQTRGLIARFEATEISSSFIWSPNSEITTTTGSIPLTPTAAYLLPVASASSTQLLGGVTGSSPPEAAVEATPETTPMKDIREIKQAGSGVLSAPTGLANPNAVRAILLSSQPSSPMRKDFNQFYFPDVSTAEDAISSPNPTLQQDIIGHNLGSRATTTYDRRIQQMIQDRTEHAQAQFQPIDTLAGKRGYLHSPLCPSNMSSDMEIEANRNHQSLRSTPTTTTQVALNSINSTSSTPIPRSTPTEILVTTQVSTVCGECNETERNMCSAGGLHMPTSRSMQQLVKGIKRRNRMASYSYNDSTCEKIGAPFDKKDTAISKSLTAIGDGTNMRRTKSCSAISLLDSALQQKQTDDDIDIEHRRENGFVPVQVQQIGGAGGSSGGRLQKSGKMLAIATATKQINDPIQCVNVATQTLEIVPQHYENSLYELLFECKEQRNNYERQLQYPQDILDQYIAGNIQTKDNVDADQYQLLCLQLQYERYRRGIHAERNRRLMGRSRDKRSLEMERDRLREQLKSFDEKNKELVQQMDKVIKVSTEREYCFNQEMTDLNGKYQNELEQNKSLRQANENLQSLLNEELVQRKEINYELESLRGQIFHLNTELQHAQQQADAGAQCKQELSRLETEFIVIGEVQVRCRDRLAEIDNFRARDEELQMLQDSYNLELKDLKHTVDDKTSQLDSAKHKIIDLQSQLEKFEKVITEQKRLLKTVKDEYEEKFKSLNKKYEVSKNIIMQMEEKMMISLQKPHGAIGPNTCSPDTDRTDIASSMDRNSPLSTSLASSESLSTSLRSTELKNLQLYIEPSDVAQVTNNFTESGVRVLPAIDLATSANTTASSINVIQQPPTAATGAASTHSFEHPIASSSGHVHTTHLHMQQQPHQMQEHQQQQQHQTR